MSPEVPAIISVSRRTDIPAFYGEWFRSRLRAGWCEVRNPFSGLPYRVSLAREDVLGWVFWSRNYEPFVDTLRMLHGEGQRFLCHFTVNGLPRVIEPRTPDAARAVETAHVIASEFGEAVVQWRYDPILLSSITTPEWHLRNFAELAGRMLGATRRCLFSFPEMYRKTLRNLAALEEEGAFRVWSPEAGDFARDDLARLSRQMAAIARENGMQLFSCCGPEWVDDAGLIHPAHCIDWPLLRSLIPGGEGMDVGRKPTRKGCGCSKSVDIGRYHTCAHGCAYCYAVDDPEKARASHRGHDPASPGL